MNIAIFTNNYLPNPYGVSMSIESFRKEFEKLGHTVYIFAPAYSNYADENKNVFRYSTVDFKYKISFPLAIPFSKKIDKILEDLEIDIIHAQHPNLLGWQAKRWAKKKNIPIVFTWHTLYDHYAHFVPLLPQKIAAAIAIKNAVDYANSVDQIIVPTPGVKEVIEKWGVKNKCIADITSGVEEKNFENADRDIIRKKYNVADDEILLLLVSRLTAEKNVRFLFDSLIGVFKNNSKIKFLVVGGGNEKNNLEKIVAKNNLNDQIFFAGIIVAENIKNYYAASDIFVHASQSETQGMILTEAMYSGLPVVAVDASGAKDLVRNNLTGFLVEESEHEFANAVLKLAGNEKLRQEFSQQAKQIAKENYTSKVCAQKMLEIYEQSIAKKIL